MDKVTLLQNAVMRASELRESKGGAEVRKWKLSHKWLVNPKVQCPYCKEWLESGRVWVIDEGRRYVHRVWKMDGTVVSPNKCHPHVGEGGKICMGDSRSGAQAIVAGLTPGETYGGNNHLHLWIPRELGHCCERLQEGKWVDVTGHKQVDHQAREHFGGEGEDKEHEGEAYCDSCDEYYDEDAVSYCERNGQHYCENCWGEAHVMCDGCNEDIHEHRGDSVYQVVNERGYDETVCEDCYSENYFNCEKCDETLPNSKHHEDGVCDECWAEGHADCEDCGEEFETNELVDGRCDDCANKLLMCSECESLAEELIDGMCRPCKYGDGIGQETLFVEEVSDGE